MQNVLFAVFNRYVTCLQKVQYDDRYVFNSNSISNWVVVQSGIWQTIGESRGRGILTIFCLLNKKVQMQDCVVLLKRIAGLTQPNFTQACLRSLATTPLIWLGLDYTQLFTDRPVRSWWSFSRADYIVRNRTKKEHLLQRWFTEIFWMDWLFTNIYLRCRWLLHRFLRIQEQEVPYQGFLYYKKPCSLRNDNDTNYLLRSLINNSGYFKITITLKISFYHTYLFLCFTLNAQFIKNGRAKDELARIFYCFVVNYTVVVFN